MSLRTDYTADTYLYGSLGDLITARPYTVAVSWEHIRDAVNQDRSHILEFNLNDGLTSSVDLCNVGYRNTTRLDQVMRSGDVADSQNNNWSKTGWKDFIFVMTASGSPHVFTNKTKQTGWASLPASGPDTAPNHLSLFQMVRFASGYDCGIRLCDVSIWNKALSDAEAALFYDGNTAVRDIAAANLVYYLSTREDTYTDEIAKVSLQPTGTIVWMAANRTRPWSPPVAQDPVVTSVNGGAPVTPGQTQVEVLGTDLDQGAGWTYGGEPVTVSQVTGNRLEIDAIPVTLPYTTGNGISRTPYQFEASTGTGAASNLTTEPGVIAAEFDGTGDTGGGAWLPQIGLQTPPSVGHQIEMTDPAGGTGGDEFIEILEGRGRTRWANVDVGDWLTGQYRIHDGASWSPARDYHVEVLP